MTFDLEHGWSITVSHGSRLEPGRWRATARAYRHGKAVSGIFEGYGSTMDAADTAAQREAEAFIDSQG